MRKNAIYSLPVWDSVAGIENCVRDQCGGLSGNGLETGRKNGRVEKSITVSSVPNTFFFQGPEIGEKLESMIELLCIHKKNGEYSGTLSQISVGW